MEGSCIICDCSLNSDSLYEMIFPDDNFRIHRVCRECYKEAYISTNKGRIYRKNNLEV